MPAEVKKEIQLEIAHVLFIDIVGYSKLSVNDQHAAVEELNQIVRRSEQFQKPKPRAVYLKSRPVMGWRWSFTPVRKRQRNAQWRSAVRSRNIPACNFGWESTAGQLAALWM